MNTPPLSLYIHFPFCIRKCAYCDFVSSPAASRKEITAYINALSHELRLLSFSHEFRGRSFSTIFFGGGTPSLMRNREIKTIIDCVKDLFGIEDGAEVSIEANPGSVTKPAEWFSQIHAAGINRLSIGVQSLDDRELALLGRLHTSADAERFVHAATAAGFGAVALDLIYGLPGQTASHWLITLDRAITLSADHISIYCLEIPPGTPLRQSIQSGEFPEPDTELQADMYYAALEKLENAGYKRYEISNFAAPGRECRHNLTYWTAVEYIGAGLAASSYVDGSRYKNVSDMKTYVGRIRAGRLPREGGERLAARRALRELAVMALRTTAGVELDRFTDAFSHREISELGTDLAGLERQGLVIATGRNSYRLAPEHTFISNSIFSLIVC